MAWGLPQTALPNILKPFHQAVIGASDAGGMGLGLALIDQMTRLHGGSITVSSGGPGMGSRFEVRLPLAQPEPHHRTGPGCRRRRLKNGACSSSMTTSTHRKASRCCLSLSAMRLRSHPTDVAVPSAWSSWRPEVALIDIGLPDLDGYEVVNAPACDESASRRHCWWR